MLSESTIKIIRDISQIISEGGGDCAEWCIGCTADVELRLLRELGIPAEYRWQICRCALSGSDARAIVQGFRNLSCKQVSDPNDTGGETAVYVFAYLKRPVMANTLNGQSIEGSKHPASGRQIFAN
jgi:hypothetical protein